MAKPNLPTNFQDDIINASMNGKRRYNLIPNADGTYSLEDDTVYDQVGSDFGAGNINTISAAVNESADKNKIIESLDDIDANTQEGMIAGAKALKQVNSNFGGLRFGIDGDGNYGYYGADDSLIPFSELGKFYFTVRDHGANGGAIFDTSKYTKMVLERIDKRYAPMLSLRIGACSTSYTNPWNFIIQLCYIHDNVPTLPITIDISSYDYIGVSTGGDGGNGFLVCGYFE